MECNRCALVWFEFFPCRSIASHHVITVFTVNRVLRNFLPIQMCDELCSANRRATVRFATALPLFDGLNQTFTSWRQMPSSDTEISKQDDDDGKEVMCEAWTKLTLGLQVILDHHKKFFENIEVFNHPESSTTINRTLSRHYSHPCHRLPRIASRSHRTRPLWACRSFGSLFRFVRWTSLLVCSWTCTSFVLLWVQPSASCSSWRCCGRIDMGT